MAGQRIGYVRVSTLDQNHQRQLEGQALDRVFANRASGWDTSRPELAELLRFALDGDTSVVHSMDRLESVVFTGENSPMANLMLSVMGAIAEFERSLIRERQREGIALAQQRGAYKGGKDPHPGTSGRVCPARRQRCSNAVLARDYGISRETVDHYLRQARLS